MMQDFNELNEILISSGVGIHASECHGFLCALICGNGQVQEQQIRDYFLLDNDETMDPEVCFNHVRALVEEIGTQIHSVDIELELLLADEESSLADRSRSLAEWCQGFMSGLGLSGINQAQIPTESKELIDDFYNIARLETEDEGEFDQENDFALMELTEYVRMGVLFIFEELQDNTSAVSHSENSDNTKSGVLH